MLHISSPIVLFSYGKVKDLSFWIRVKFHLGREKRRGKRGIWERSPKMRVIFAKFPLLSKIQTLSCEHLVRQTSNHHHCNCMAKHLHVRIFKCFQAVLPGQKQLCVFLRNTYGFQIGNAMEKLNSILPRKK